MSQNFFPVLRKAQNSFSIASLPMVVLF
jgi:hypothetical protein